MQSHTVAYSHWFGLSWFLLHVNIQSKLFPGYFLTSSLYSCRMELKVRKKMKFLVLQDNFECCSYKRFDSMVWETVGEARTSTRRTSFGFYSCRDAICSIPERGGGLEEREWRDGSCVSRRSHTMARPKNGQEEVGGRENGTYCCVPSNELLGCCCAAVLAHC